MSEMPRLELGDIRAFMRYVPNYTHLSDGDIQIKGLRFADLQPLQKSLTPRKLQRAEFAVREHIAHRMRLFSPIWMPTDVCPDIDQSPSGQTSGRRIWLPPIVELHGYRYVIIDGHHRLYYLYVNFEMFRHDLPVDVIALSNVREDFPATPFASMSAWMRTVHVDETEYSRGRSSRYNNFDQAHWRHLSDFYEQDVVG